MSAASGSRRGRTERLYVRSLGPRELEALDLIEQRPGVTVAELADALGISVPRVRQMVRRLQLGRVRREGSA